ncbi:MAG: hypothetical protein IPP90_15870 [Gemmatimonadaceae bacterium]|nr:hypothetical protein [Gemmatimonadaceae bacterium]
MNEEAVSPNQFVKPVIDSIMKARNATTPNAADTAAAKADRQRHRTTHDYAQGMAPGGKSTTISEGRSADISGISPRVGRRCLRRPRHPCSISATR